MTRARSRSAAGRVAPVGLAVGLVLMASIALPGAAAAEPAADGDAREWIRPEQVSARADALLRRLEAAPPDAAAMASLATIERSLPELLPEIDALLARARDAERSGSPPVLDDVERELAGAAAPLVEWKGTLTVEAKRVADGLDEIAREARIWSATRGRPETAAAGAVVAQRVQTVLDALAATEATLRTWRGRVLAVSDRLIERIAVVDAASARLREANVRERASLLVPDRDPLWSRGFADEIRRELPRVPDEVRAYAAGTIGYIERDPRPLVVQALVAAILMLGLAHFASRARTRLAGDEAAAPAARLLERPYAIGLLLTLLASPVFHPLAPRRVIQLGALLALMPAARIVTHASEVVNPLAFAGLFVLLVLDRLGWALQPLPALQRATFLLSLVVAAGLASWLARADGPAWRRRAAGMAAAGLAIALVAEVAGWTYLATLIGRGIVTGAIALLYVYAAWIALAAFLAYLLATHTARRSRLVGRNAALLQRRTVQVLRWLGVGLWLYLVAMALGLRGAVADVSARLFGAGISIGALSISVGGVLAFVLTLVTALLLARVLTAVLEEEVYPRTHLPRGVPYALSTLARYGIYSLGFFCALVAAGVRLEQLSIMLGGLGIGLGLGLQDLVKNFAAGLTLLFERRLHVGDAVEMPSQGVVGRVLAIGTRATVIRSWTGAEVVVPNGDLVAGAVTNWTLSDRLCRLEVPVGVAYGADPERVLAVLLDAVASVEELLADPPPQALFKAFGGSSLDFVVRAWTDEGYENVLALTSRLGVAVYRRLRDAGIEIPFPQRALHLASVSPASRAALSAAGRTDGTTGDRDDAG